MNQTEPSDEMFLYRSRSNDVYVNLAIEEYLFDTLPARSCGFMLYVDAPSVVFGKHQNPWRECSVADLRARGIPLARRISGGGTVYHDLGNLNFSFILPKVGFDRKRNLDVVVRALDSFGIKAEISERHDVMVGDRKISGNAFCFRHNRALHHGTLLIQSKLRELHGALAGIPGIETFAVPSKPSPVANLAATDASITVERVSGALMSEIARRWADQIGSAPVYLSDRELDQGAVQSLAARNRQPEWIFGRTPQFKVRFAVPDGSPSAELVLQVKEGRVTDESFDELPGFTPEEATLLARRLSGVQFDSKELASALQGLPTFSKMADWLLAQGF